MFYDGRSTKYLLAALTGYQIPANISSSGNQMHTVFSSDGYISKSGYYAKIHTSGVDAAYFEAEGLESKKSSSSKVSIEPMLCSGYISIGNGICDQANDNLVCYFDGGDCSLGGNTINCTSLECVDDVKFDPCPKYDKIGNDQCDKENFNVICSFDAGDCQTG